MPDDPHTKLLADTAKRELMALDFNAIQSVDIRPLGQVYLANLFKSLRRFEVLAMQDYEPPNLALRFARDICNVRRCSCDVVTEHSRSPTWSTRILRSVWATT
jgi:hypothetical protein